MKSPKPRFTVKAGLVCLLVFLGLTVVTVTQAQTQLYSRVNNGNYNTAATWTTSATHAGAAYGGAINGSVVLNIGAGHNIIVPSNSTGTVGGIVVGDTGNGTLTIGNNTNTAATLNVSNATINSPGTIIVTTTGTIRPGGDNGGVHVINVSGSITNNGVFNMIGASGDVANVSFIDAGAKIVSGTGTTTFRNLTMNTGSSANVNVNQNISVTGVLNFTANGLLIVKAANNITMARGATFGTVGSATQYIQLDGSTASTGSLIKTSNNTTASWQTTYPIGTSTGGYTPLVISAVTTAPTDNATLAVKAIYNSSIQGQLRRTFRLTVAGNAAASTFDGNFHYNQTADVSAGDVLNNYTNIWYLNSGGGNWTSIGGDAPPSTLGYFSPTVSPGIVYPLSTGTYYFTLGTAAAYPNTWYSYQTGVWSNWENWTLDPSGTTLVNGLNLPPQPGDEIVILNGFTITNDVNGQVASNTTIQGGATLDMVATTANTLGTVSGEGILRMQGVNLPIGNYTAFVATTGGTVEYYNSGGTLPVGQTTYNKLKLTNSTASGIDFLMISNLTVNNTLDVTATGTGLVTWKINDASNTQRTINITGDLTVSANGRIRVGTGNEASTSPHILNLYSDLINNGSIKFFDDADTELADTEYTNGNVYSNERQGNAVNVTMAGTVTNSAVITCNGLTDFYRLILDKGTGQQAMLSVNSSNAANFRLFGPSNLYSSGTQPDVISNCALSIANGTLQLLGKITIPRLIVNGTAGAPTDVFSIPQSGALWLNSPDVSVTVTDNNTGNDDQRLQVNGLLRVTSGTLSCGYSRGIGSYTGGVVFVEGGTVNMWQYRPVFGGSNVFVYRQTGGTVNVGTTGENGTPALSGVLDNITEQFARFSLPTATSSFQMSGNSVLNVGSPSENTTTTGAQGIDIQSATSNYNVTGGTVNIYIPPSGTDRYDFGINSTAPFYNLNVYKTSSTGTRAAILKQALTVVNNLTIITGNTPVFYCANNNLTIGGSFEMQTGTTFNTGTVATPSGANVLTFNGSGIQNWLHNGTISNLTTVVMNKSAGTLALGGSGTFPNITAALTLTSGTLDDGGKIVTATTSLTNSAVHMGTGAIIYSNAASTIINGDGGTFGNLHIQSNTTILLAGNQTITGNLRLLSTQSTLNIRKYSLKVLGGIYTDGTTGVAFSNTRRIQTNGLPNDDGLTRQAASGVDLLMPVGTGSTLYTPITINATATTAGLITVVPVIGAHPNVTTTGQSVRFYWRVLSSGFSGLGAVTHKLYTFSNSPKDNPTTAYRAARYDPVTFKWAYNNATTFNGISATVIPNFNTGTGWTGLSTDQLDGEYTAGNQIAFGAVTVFYSSNTPSNWNSASSWSDVAVGNAGGAGVPCATCPVVIGNGVLNHTIAVDADGQSCGSLQINTGSTLDCKTFINLNFGVNNRGNISGRGAIRIASATFPSGDFSDFTGPSGGTVEWYGASAVIPGPAALSTYYNLKISPDAGATITLPPTSFTVYNDFTISGVNNSTSNVITSVGATRTVIVNGALIVSGGKFVIQNGNITNFVVGGNSTIGTGASFGVQDQNAPVVAITHSFTTSGGIANSGTLLFKGITAGGATEVVNMIFQGTSNANFTTSSGASSRLNLMTVDKGTSQTPTLTIDGAGSMTPLTNSWLILSNGTLNFNFTGTSGSTTPGTFTLLSTTTTAYNIPATAKLKVQVGTVNVTTAANSNGDLTLAGGLEVTGGRLNVGASGNNNDNDIEYAAAGLPLITVSGGTLYVNGSIRRSLSTLSGALAYTQAGGTVTLGGRSSNNTRGVFEIENNSGSNFTLTGGVLQIQRTTSGTGYADLFLNPVTSSVSPGSIIEMGLTNATQAMSYNVAVPIGSFTIIGGTGTQSVSMYSNDMIATGNVLINTNCTLNTTSTLNAVTNSYDVTVGGNLTIDGTYNGANNTTTFNGGGAQIGKLSSSSSFLNMTVNKSSGTVALQGTAPTLNNLNILNGTLDVGTMDLKVNRDITNNSFQIGSGKITLSSTAPAHIITSSNGSFTNLTLGATGVTKTVTVAGNMTILGTLDFPAPVSPTVAMPRYLKIGSNRLTFGTLGVVTNASVNDFIRTNGVSSDLGVMKMWATGNRTFNYAVGTRINYTPVELNLNVTTAGSYTVIPVDDQHPTANAMGEQILNYYWIGLRDATLTFGPTGYHSYQFPTAFIGGTGGTFTPAHLDAINLIGWTTYAMPVPTKFEVAGTGFSTKMTFTNIQGVSLPVANGEFHYTAGTPGTAMDPNHTLPNPITAVYSRFSDNGGANATNVGNLTVGGDWNLATNWTLETDGTGAGLSVVPVGRPIVILPDARMNMNIPGLRAFKSTIDGLLVVGKQTGEVTAGHSLGAMSGAGTLQTRTSTLPAGNYTNFVSAAGGTIEYAVPITPAAPTLTMNNRSTYNNLSIKEGIIIMTNTDLVLNGNVTIATGSKLDNSVNNRNMAVAKNFTTVGTGVFEPGTGSVGFTGTTNSIITGVSNGLYGLEVAKTGAGTVSSANPLTVNGNLTMTTGTYESTATNLLTVSATGTTSGGSSASFVVGPMRKELLAGGSFAFPIGNTTDSRYRPAGIYNPTADDFWTALYIGNNPTDDGYNRKALNGNSIKKVSMFEYWLLSRDGGTTADVELSYSTGSYIPNVTNVGTVSNLRVVHWDAGTSRWDFPSGGGSFSQAGSNVTGTVRVTGVDSFSPFTLGSTDLDSPLPVKWGPVEANWVSTAVEVKWVTLQEENNDHFDIQRSEDGVSFVSIGTIAGAGNTTDKQTYRFKDNEASMARRYYYRIRQVDYNGLSDYSPLAVVMPLDGNERQKSWLAYPNPLAKDADFVLYRSDEVVPQQVQVTLYSAQGILIYQGSGSLQDVNTAVSKYLQNAHSGVYMLQVSDGMLSQGFKIVRP